jgi:hypothetical protein
LDTSPDTEGQPRQPFYETNLFWGCFGAGLGIVVTVVAAMIRDLRWLLLIACPLFWVSIWAATKNISYMTTKVAVRISGWVIIAIALYALNVRLIPVTDQPQQPPQLTGQHPEIGQQTPPPQAKPDPPRESTRQSEKTKQEQPEKKEEVHNDLKLIFKNSPLLTASRKKRILSDMNLFRNYLIKVGFNAPIEFPSIGVDKKGIQMYDSGKPVYASSIFIPEAMIDVPIYYDKIYAEYMATSILKPDIQNDPWDILTIGRI